MPSRRALITAAIAVVVALILDGWAYDHLTYASVYDKDWGRLLRVLGYWPTWIVAALALWLQERGTMGLAKRRALLLLAAPALAGVAAEVLKLAFRRLRPMVADGEYVFRSIGERTFSTSGLALPSSHVMVAFGAAATLAYLFPRAKWVWFSLAAGCALTRVLARAHFVSDVVVGAVAAIATTAWLLRRGRRSTAYEVPGFPPAE